MMGITPIVVAVVNCYVGCNTGVPNGQTQHVLECDTDTSGYVVQSATAVAGGNVKIDEIVCGGRYQGHLQGTDAAGTNIWWSFTTKLVRTDFSGRVLAFRDVSSHHGDLCVKGDTLYVAVNHGSFNTETGGKSFVMSYDAMTLAPKDKWKIDMPFGAGGMTWCGDSFYVIGGLPPTERRNYVHEYDMDFKLVKRHALETGYTSLGIQTAAFIDGEFLFGIYGGHANPGGTLRCPADLSSVRRYFGKGSVGYAKINGRIYTATTHSASPTMAEWSVGTLRPDDGLLADTNLCTLPWYSRGVPKDAPIRAAHIALGTGRGTMQYQSSDEWELATKKLVDKGYNAVIINLLDGYAYPSHLELAAKGAWDGKRFRDAIRRLREIGLEAIPCLDLSVGRCSWIGKKAGTPEGLALCLELVKDVHNVACNPRFFQIVADGWSAADSEEFRQAIIANGYGSCPWPVGGYKEIR